MKKDVIDILIEKAMPEILDILDKETEEELKNAPIVNFSKEHEEKMKKIFEQARKNN